MRIDSSMGRQAGAGASGPEWRALAIDVAVIVLLSLMAILAFGRRAELMTADSRGYLVPAQNLLLGRGFAGEGQATTFTRSIRGYPNIPGPDTLRTPGYPLLIALFLAAGAGLRGLVVFQHLLNVAIAIALYWFLRRASKSRAIALIAAASYALLPPVAELANTLMAETIFTALALAVIISAYGAIRRHSVGLAIASGMLLGAAVLVKPVATYFFIPLVAIAAMASGRRLLLPVALLISTQVLPMGWALRNRSEAGVTTISTAATENLLFEWAASVQATRNASPWFRLTAAQQQLGFRSTLHRVRLPLFYQAMAIARADGVDPVRLNPAQKSVYERRLALHILRRHPIDLAEIAISGVLELLIFEPPLMAFSVPYVPRSAETALAFVTIASLLLVIRGIGSLYRSNRVLALLAGATIVYFVAVTAIPEAVNRYALVYAPMYCTGLAAGLVHYARRYAPALASSRARRAATSGPS